MRMTVDSFELAQAVPATSNTPHPSGLATIAAIATPLGRGGVGVIRLSGARAYAICHLYRSPSPRDS